MDITSYLLGKKSGGGAGTLQDKSVTITSNGTTNVTADAGFDGLSSVAATVNVPTGTETYFKNTISTSMGERWQALVKAIPVEVTVEGTNPSYVFQNYKGTTLPKINIDSQSVYINYMFDGCSNLTELDISNFSTSKVENMGYMFSGCVALSKVTFGQDFVTSKVTAFQSLFSNCQAINNLDLSGFDFSKAGNVQNMFANCFNLRNLTFGTVLGKGYATTATAHYNRYTLNMSDCINITHDSLMSVINNLYDIGTAGVPTQDLILGSTNLAKLSQAEQDIATAKGWTLS